MNKHLIKALLYVILMFAGVAAVGLSLWLVNDLWLVILAIIAVLALVKFLIIK